MDNGYNRNNRRKYSLKVHIVLVTKYRKRLLQSYFAYDIKQKIHDIYNSHSNKKQHIIFGTDTIVFFPSNIGRNISFGLMAILLVVLEKYHQLLYKNTSRVRDNG